MRRLLTHSVALIAALCLLGLPAAARGTAQGDAILDLLRLDELLVILQEEAVVSGGDLAEQMLPGRSQRGWADTLSRLNAPGRIGPILRGRFGAALDPDAAEEIAAFFRADEGQRIVALELSARTALNDPDIEAAVLARHADMVRNGDPRADQIDTFIAVNDLIDSNVAGALNANAAFLKGLNAATGGLGDLGVLPDGDAAILAEVWSQEPEIRDATEDWVTAFLALAYQPLDHAAMDRYTAFSASPAGQAFNRALFAAFDAVFTDTSFETGLALGRLMASEDL